MGRLFPLAHETHLLRRHTLTALMGDEWERILLQVALLLPLLVEGALMQLLVGIGFREPDAPENVRALVKVA